MNGFKIGISDRTVLRKRYLNVNPGVSCNFDEFSCDTNAVFVPTGKGRRKDFKFGVSKMEGSCSIRYLVDALNGAIGSSDG